MKDPSAIRSHRKLTLGLTLLTAGLALWLDVPGLIEIPSLGDLWPLIPIVIGVHCLTDPEKENRRSGLPLLVIGVGFLALTTDFYGIGWQVGRPLLMISGGLFLIVRFLAQRPHANGMENGNGHR